MQQMATFLLSLCPGRSRLCKRPIVESAADLTEVYPMPMYEFLCATCGLFEQRRSLTEAGDPMACPTCQVVAQRIYSTGGFILTSGAFRRRIEQSLEPQVVTRTTPEAPSPLPTLQQSVRSRPWHLGHTTHAVPVEPKLQRL
jgi:putative FmdB family regulatory protein